MRRTYWLRLLLIGVGFLGVVVWWFHDHIYLSLQWMLDAVGDTSSPILIGKEVFQNLFAASVGALISLCLIAPLTARWIAAENRKKWKPAQNVATRQVRRLAETFIWTIGGSVKFDTTHMSLLSFHGTSDFFRTSREDQKAFLTILAAVQTRLESAYLKWGAVWTPAQHSAICTLIDLLYPFRAELVELVVDCISSHTERTLTEQEKHLVNSFSYLDAGFITGVLQQLEDAEITTERYMSSWRSHPKSLVEYAKEIDSRKLHVYMIGIFESAFRGRADDDFLFNIQRRAFLDSDQCKVPMTTLGYGPIWEKYFGARHSSDERTNERG